MPVQQTKSLLEILGAKGQQAHEKTKKQETTYGMVNLPAGIVGGVAELRTVTWKVYEANDKDVDKRGKPYVLFRGIAQSPKTFNGASVAGLPVMLTCPLYDQSAKSGGRKNPKSFEENYADLLNEFRKFGVPTDNMQFSQLEAVMKHLTERPKEQRCFHFSTRGFTPPATTVQPKPTEMIFVQFDGKCDPAAVVKQGTEDHSAESLPQEAGEPANAPAADEPSVGGSQADADGVLSELAVAADGGDTAAIVRLGELALAAGLTKEFVEDVAQNWGEVVIAMAGGAPPADESGSATAAPDEDEPTTGTICRYLVIDAATGKPKVNKFKKDLPPVTCEVTIVDPTTKTCTLRSKADPKVLFKNVKWADLLAPE